MTRVPSQVSQGTCPADSRQLPSVLQGVFFPGTVMPRLNNLACIPFRNQNSPRVRPPQDKLESLDDLLAQAEHYAEHSIRKTERSGPSPNGVAPLQAGA